MKKLIKTIGLMILIISLLFSAFAFGNWDANPKHWEEFGRGIFSLISFALIMGGIALYLNEDFEL